MSMEENGAAEWTRTIDPVLTKDVLYHLSYGSAPALGSGFASGRPEAATKRVGMQGSFGLDLSSIGAPIDGLTQRAVRASFFAMGDSKEARAARQAAALRRNLQRRKAQGRLRRDEASDEDRKSGLARGQQAPATDDRSE